MNPRIGFPKTPEGRRGAISKKSLFEPFGITSVTIPNDFRPPVKGMVTNIQARVEPENITYFYPGREVGKRGRNLDPSLDKPGLEKKFNENLERYNKSPEIRVALSKLRGADVVPPEKKHPTTQLSPPVSDLVSKRTDGMTLPREGVLQQSIIPLEEIQKAKTQSILKYCEREKIRTVQNTDGKTLLKDREHVELSDYSWINHKNKTQGTLIDFVANHRATSLLHAVSIINDNPNLMLLEAHIGEANRSYRSFNIPKEDSATRPEAIRQIAIFLNHKAQSHQYASLFKSQGVQVTHDNRIRFFTEKDQTGYLEYIPLNDGQYRKQVHGEVRSPFLNQKSQSSQLSIYLEPRFLLSRQPNAFEKDAHRKDGVLVLLEPNIAIAHQAIATQKNIKQVRVMRSPLEAETPEASRFFEDLRDSLDPFSIDTSMAWESLSPEQPQREKYLEQPFDMSRI